MIKYEDDDYDLIDTYEDACIFKKAVPSQYYSVLYNRLAKDKRLDDFLKILKVCSMSGKTLKQTCEHLSVVFKGYVRDIKVTPDMLNKMRCRYIDVNNAMTFDREMALLDAFENGAMIAAVTDKMKDVVDFVNTFDKVGMFTGIDKTEQSNKTSKIDINVNNKDNEQHTKQTRATDDLIMESLRNVQLVVPEAGNELE